VIDLLNVEESFEHHYRAYGFWAPAIAAYQASGIMRWAGTPELAALLKIEDPYAYRDRLTITKALAVTSVRSIRAIFVSKELPVEPQIFIARAVINAVDHDGQAFHLRIPAGGGTVVVDHRAGAVLLQLLVDRPHEALALFRIGFHRLPVEFLLELAVTIAGVIALRAARKVLVEGLVGIVEAVLLQIEPDDEVLAHDLGIPVDRVDFFELTVDVDLLQLVDEDDRRVAVLRDVARRDDDFEPIVGAVAWPLHNLAGFRAVLCDIGVVTGQAAQHFRRHSPDPFGRRQHRAADIGLALVDRVDEGLAVEAQCQCPPDIGITERR